MQPEGGFSMAKLEIVFCKVLFLNGCSSSSCPAKVNTPTRIVFFIIEMPSYQV